MKYVFYVTYTDGTRDILECPDKDSAVLAYDAFARRKRVQDSQVTGYGTLELKYYSRKENDRIRTFY